MDVEAPQLADFARYRVEPGEPFSLAGHDPADTGGLGGPDDVESEYDALRERIAGLQERLHAEEDRSRYDSINDFERMLVREGTTILKFLLHISKEEQLEKFRERLARPDKYFKWSDNDVKERKRWDDYQQAYEDAVNATSTAWAPWYVVPADNRWYRNYVIARILAGTLERMDPRYPEPPADVKAFAERELEQAR